MALHLIVTDDDLQWARQAVDTAQHLFPGFCAEGVAYGLDKQRRAFEDRDLPLVVIARHWLNHYERSKNISERHSSYGCKHFAERWADCYVSNAALIAAAAGMGIRQRPTHLGSPNTYLALKYSSWAIGSNFTGGCSGLDPAVSSISVVNEQGELAPYKF